MNRIKKNLLLAAYLVFLAGGAGAQQAGDQGLKALYGFEGLEEAARRAEASGGGAAALWLEAGKGILSEAEAVRVLPIRYATAMSLFPDGERALIASSTGLSERSLRDGREIASIPSGTLGIKGLAVAPNGKLAAGCDFQGGAEVWDLETGRSAGRLQFKGSRITAVAFTPDSAMAITGDADGAVKLWSLGDLEPAAISAGHKAGVVHLEACSGDGSIVWVAEDGTVCLWNGESERMLRDPRGRYESVASADLCPDGNLIALNSFGAAIVYDCLEQSARREIRAPDGSSSFDSLQISDDGRYMATLTRKGRIDVWRIADGRRLRTYSFYRQKNISAKGMLLASGDFGTLVNIGDPKRQGGMLMAVVGIAGDVPSGPVPTAGQDGETGASPAGSASVPPQAGRDEETLERRVLRDLRRQNYAAAAGYFNAAQQARLGYRLIVSQAASWKDFDSVLFYSWKARPLLFVAAACALAAVFFFAVPAASRKRKRALEAPPARPAVAPAKAAPEGTDRGRGGKPERPRARETGAPSPELAKILHMLRQAAAELQAATSAVVGRVAAGYEQTAVLFSGDQYRAFAEFCRQAAAYVREGKAISPEYLPRFEELSGFVRQARAEGERRFVLNHADTVQLREWILILDKARSRIDELEKGIPGVEVDEQFMRALRALPGIEDREQKIRAFDAAYSVFERAGTLEAGGTSAAGRAATGRAAGSSRTAGGIRWYQAEDSRRHVRQIVAAVPAGAPAANAVQEVPADASFTLPNWAVTIAAVPDSSGTERPALLVKAKGIAELLPGNELVIALAFYRMEHGGLFQVFVEADSEPIRTRARQPFLAEQARSPGDDRDVRLVEGLLELKKLRVYFAGCGESSDSAGIPSLEVDLPAGLRSAARSAWKELLEYHRSLADTGFEAALAQYNRENPMSSRPILSPKG